MNDIEREFWDIIQNDQDVDLDRREARLQQLLDDARAKDEDVSELDEAFQLVLKMRDVTKRMRAGRIERDGQEDPDLDQLKANIYQNQADIDQLEGMIQQLRELANRFDEPPA